MMFWRLLTFFKITIGQFAHSGLDVTGDADIDNQCLLFDACKVVDVQDRIVAARGADYDIGLAPGGH